jgi:ribose transport system ATP-binding protein
MTEEIIETQATTEKEPLLIAKNITKKFPGVVALDNVSVEFFPGEVHAVVGENGAGKSTLMKVVAGAYSQDEGDVLLAGEVVDFSHPQEAQRQGIAIIYQEFNLLPERTVAQNIFLGREPSRYGVINQRELNKMALEVLKDIGVDSIISPTEMTSSLSVADSTSR